MSRILAIVHACNACPNRRYYSGGAHECSAVGQVIPTEIDRNGYIAEWCPLPPHPAHAMEQMRAELNRLKAAQETLGEHK